MNGWRKYEDAYSAPGHHPMRFWENAVFAENGTLVATSHAPTPEQAAAIASLIAAAPDLLAVVKSFAADDPCASGDPRYQSALNAIAKAEKL